MFKVFNGCFEKSMRKHLTNPRRIDQTIEKVSTTSSFKDREVCPYCGVKTRKESRKRGNNNGDKPRVNMDFEGD